jgi:peptidoglycan DL-endopeptidase CwlO
MVVGVGVAAVIAGSTAASAAADPIADKKSQAQALAAQIDTLGRKEGALAEQYDGAVIQAQQTATKLQQAQQGLSAAQANSQKVRGVLQSNAVDAYVHGGSLAAVASRNGSQGAGVTDGVLRGEYLRTLSQTESDALDAYRSAIAQEQEAKAELQSTQKAQNQALVKVNAARNAASAATRQLEATLNKVKGDLAALVAQAQAAQEAAALQAAQAAALAREQRQQAVAAAAVVASRGGARALPVATGAAPTASQPAPVPSRAPSSAGPAPPPPAPPPPVAGSGRGAAAVGAAETRLGMPYVFGGGGPNVFDCSGLVMWAYAQVGVSLPHNAGAQYAMSQHIPMSALQPGDLVFAAGLGHVAMYIGGGMIIEALHTGTPVHIVPMWSFLVLAGRI